MMRTRGEPRVKSAVPSGESQKQRRHEGQYGRDTTFIPTNEIPDGNALNPEEALIAKRAELDEEAGRRDGAYKRYKLEHPTSLPHTGERGVGRPIQHGPGLKGSRA